MSPVRNRPHFAAVLASHRSTPTTPSEESKYRKYLGDNLSLSPFSDWRETTPVGPESSPNGNHELQNSSSGHQFNDENSTVECDDEQTDMATAVTPPSTPSFLSTSLGSPTLTYGGKVIKDASGTRRMMLRRKNSALRK